MKKIFRKPYSYWIIGVAVLISLIVSSYLYQQYKLNEASAKPLSYREFLQKVESDQIKSVLFSPLKLHFQAFDAKNTYSVSNPVYPEFKKFLLENGIEVIDEKPTLLQKVLKGFLELLVLMLPLLFIFYIFRTSMPRKNVKNENVASSSTIRFTDIAGNEETKQDMIVLVDFLKNPKKYQELGAKLPKGVILHGPPGTGKTLFAKAIAGEAGVPFFNVSASEFVEMYVGVGASRVRKLFEEARQKAPCVIFIDELEALAKKSAHDNSEKEQTLKQFLVELDGFQEFRGILVIGATNHLSALDETFTRSGRFDRHITIGLPDIQDRRQIIAYHAKGKPFSKDIDFENLAKTSSSLSGADLAKILNEAAIHASIHGKSQIDNEDLEEAIYRTLMKGYQKKTISRNTNEQNVIAYHEAGHAIVARFLAKRNVPKVTIIPSTSGAGGVTFIHSDKETLLSKEDLIRDIQIAYGGRAAELVLFGDENKITTGARSDIAVATNKLDIMVKSFGMSRLGLINFDILNITSEQILNEIKKMAETIFNETYQFVSTHRDQLDAVAQMLLQKEVLFESDLDQIWDQSMNSIKNKKHA